MNLSKTAKAILQERTGNLVEQPATQIRKLTDIISDTQNSRYSSITELCSWLYCHADPYDAVSQFMDAGDIEKAYGLWLTTPDNAVHTITPEYEIPEEPIILADLDTDGVLFIYPRHPKHYKNSL